MPNFLFEKYDSQKDYPLQIAAYLLSTSKAPSDEWLAGDEATAITAYLVTLGSQQPADDALKARLADPANVAAGEKLVRKFGCPGCHDIPGMESESRIGAELSTFGGKQHEELFFGDRTDLSEDWATWTFHKLKE